MKKNQTSLFASALLSFCPVVALAQAPMGGSVTADFSAFRGTEIDEPGISSEFEGSVTAFSGSFMTPLSERAVVTVDAGIKSSNLDWDGGGFDFGAGFTAVPFDESQVVDLRLGLRYRLNDRWGLMGNIGLQSTEGEGGEFPNNAPDAEELLTGMLVVSYSASPDLTWLFGAIASEQLEDDARVIPFVGVRWQFAPQWLLETRNGVILNYTYNEALSFDSSFLFGGDSLPIGEVAGSVVAVNQSGFEAELGVTWQATETIAVRPYVGFGVAQEWEFRWRDQELASFDLESSLHYGLAVTASW